MKVRVTCLLLTTILMCFSLNTALAANQEKTENDFVAKINQTEQEKNTSVSKASNKKGLDAFIGVYIEENLELRSKNVKGLYNKALESPKTDLLFNSIYKALGYKNRNSPVFMPTELIGHRYKDNHELFKLDELSRLENTFALLDSTLSRMNNEGDEWIEPTIRKNLIVDAIHTWFRNQYNVEYSQVLDALSQDSLIKLREISKQRFNLEKKLWNQTQIALLDLRADSSALSQYFLLENSNIYLNTGFQKLPNRDELWTLQLGSQKFCSSDSKTMEQGFDFLVRSFPTEMDLINKSTIDDKKSIWAISQVSQKLAKRALVFSKKRQIRKAVYALTDLVHERILLLNQRRINKFLVETETFFLGEQPAFNFRGVDTMQASLHEIFELMLLDYFLASERTAFASLIFHRQCGLNADAEWSSNFSEILNNQYTKNLNIKGFAYFSKKRITHNNDLMSFSQKNFLNKVTMAKVVDLLDVYGIKTEGDSVVSANNSSVGTSIESTVSPNEIIKRPLTEKTNTFNQTDVNSSRNQVQQSDVIAISELTEKTLKEVNAEENIRYADFPTASAILEKRNIHLLSEQEINQTFKGRGYTMQVVSTTSPDDVMYTIKKYQEKEDVYVYMSKVVIDNETISIFKILVGARNAATVSRKDYLKLLDVAKRRNAFLKPFSFVRADVAKRS